MNDLRNVVSGQNIDAIVASRLVKVDKTVTYIPGQAYPMFPVYGTFYGYYGAIYPVVYSPDYLRVDKTAQVETNFYSTAAPDGELVWTCTSDTVNPHRCTIEADRAGIAEAKYYLSGESESERLVFAGDALT
jgi:hypothetical protein